MKPMPLTPSQLLLQIHFVLRRIGVHKLAVAFAALLAMLAWQLHVTLAVQADAAMARRDAAQSVHQQLRGHIPAPSADTENLQNFRTALGDGTHIERQVESLFAIARKQGLELARGEYKLQTDSAGGFLRYDVMLPLEGPYPAIDAFVEQALLALPHAALTELRVKRNGPAATRAEARLRFSLFLVAQARPAGETP